MMNDPFARPEIPRDRWGRPLVVPPGGGKPVPYTRCTTYVDCLEDKYNLQRWQQRMVALGLAARDDLLVAVAASKDDKERLNSLCELAIEAAQGGAAARTGTALHTFTEMYDRGELRMHTVPHMHQADLEAYGTVTADLKMVDIETFGVLDSLRIGGTWDRIVEHDGRRYIADIKTGSIEYGIHKIAMQLAVYVHCVTYDPVTYERGETGVDMDKALIIHLPAGQGTCELVWVNIWEGWEAVQLATLVRAWRAHKGLTWAWEES